MAWVLPSMLSKGMLDCFCPQVLSYASLIFKIVCVCVCVCAIVADNTKKN